MTIRHGYTGLLGCLRSCDRSECQRNRRDRNAGSDRLQSLRVAGTARCNSTRDANRWRLRKGSRLGRETWPALDPARSWARCNRATHHGCTGWLIQRGIWDSSSGFGHEIFEPGRPTASVRFACRFPNQPTSSLKEDSPVTERWWWAALHLL